MFRDDNVSATRDLPTASRVAAQVTMPFSPRFTELRNYIKKKIKEKQKPNGLIRWNRRRLASDTETRPSRRKEAQKA